MTRSTDPTDPNPVQESAPPAPAPEERLAALPTWAVQLASGLYDETIDVSGADDPAFSWKALAAMAEMLVRHVVPKPAPQPEAARPALGMTKLRDALRVILEASSILDAAEFYPSWSPTEREAWDRLKAFAGQPEAEAPPVPPAQKYDPTFGDDRVCVCGHRYYRHFDTYEEMRPVGCKYCDCAIWVAFLPAESPNKINELGTNDGTFCPPEEPPRPPAAPSPMQPHKFEQGSGWGCVYNHVEPGGLPTNISALCMLPKGASIHVEGEEPPRGAAAQAPFPDDRCEFVCEVCHGEGEGCVCPCHERKPRGGAIFKGVLGLSGKILAYLGVDDPYWKKNAALCGIINEHTAELWQEQLARRVAEKVGRTTPTPRGAAPSEEIAQEVIKALFAILGPSFQEAQARRITPIIATGLIAVEAAARAEEREECAKLAEGQRARQSWRGEKVCNASTAKWYDGFDRAKTEIATAIRTRVPSAQGERRGSRERA